MTLCALVLMASSLSVLGRCGSCWGNGCRYVEQTCVYKDVPMSEWAPEEDDKAVPEHVKRAVLKKVVKHKVAKKVAQAKKEVAKKVAKAKKVAHHQKMAKAHMAMAAHAASKNS